jgi:hypothetical protein
MTRKFCLSVAAAAALCAGSAQAANEYFVRVAGIAGTSNVLGLEDYIPVLFWSLGFEDGACQGLQFVKQMDASSADLTAAALSGVTYPRITLIARRQGAPAFLYMRLTLTNSVFTSFKTAGTAGGSDPPTEQISARPASVKTELFEQNDKGGRELVASSEVNCPRT